MKINNVNIGAAYRPYVIAEISANHNGKIENAMRLIELAKSCGASAVKLQTYKPELLTLDSPKDDFLIHEGLWRGKTLFDLYKLAYTPWEWMTPLFRYAKKIDITIFSTPFDETAVDLLESLDAPAYKVASFELNDHQLLERIGKTRKPVILSTGMANLMEIEASISVLKASGAFDIALLHCVSGYPAPIEDCHLNTIADLKLRTGLEVGLSDHTIGNLVAAAGVALGATIIEKHFTLDKNGGGPDDSFSMEPTDLSALVRDVEVVHRAIGNIDYSLKPSEAGNIKFRRSLYFVKDMQDGDVIDETCIRSIRPGFGLSPQHYKSILGRRVVGAVTVGDKVSFEVLEDE